MYSIHGIKVRSNAMISCYKHILKPYILPGSKYSNISMLFGKGSTVMSQVVHLDTNSLLEI